MNEIIQKNDMKLEIVKTPINNIPVGYENYFDIGRYEQIGRMANAFSRSDLVPTIYRGKPENCFIAIHLGMKLGIDPILAMQSIYIVNGNPGMSAQLAISLANRSGVFDGNIVFSDTESGDDLFVTATAKLKNGGQIVSKTMSLKSAQLAGWANKPVWKSQPIQMLSYRVATQLIRLYAPDALLGMRTTEEWEDVGEDVQVKKSNITNKLRSLAEGPQNELKADEAKEPAKRGRKPKNDNPEQAENRLFVSTPTQESEAKTETILTEDQEVFV